MTFTRQLLNPALMLAAMLLLLPAQAAPPAQADSSSTPKNLFRYNDQHYELNYAYVCMNKAIDIEHSDSNDPMHPKMIDAPNIMLSDKPVDAKALQPSPGHSVVAKVDDLAAATKAAVLFVQAGPDDSIQQLALRLPVLKDFVGDFNFPGNATLNLDRSKPGQLVGRVVITGDLKSHESDPKNLPFVQSDISFQTDTSKSVPSCVVAH